LFNNINGSIAPSRSLGVTAPGNFSGEIVSDILFDVSPSTICFNKIVGSGAPVLGSTSPFITATAANFLLAPVLNPFQIILKALSILEELT
jgi:hypothetical protein